MTAKIDYVLADPAGNKTILVLSQVDRKDYQKTAQLLLEHCPQAEQVGFIKSVGREGCEDLPYMEMCGLEFCGNASRAFAYFEASLHEPPLRDMRICVSGSEKPLEVTVDVTGNRSRIEMPVPLGMTKLEIPIRYSDDEGKETDLKVTGDLVEMEGIDHLIVNDLPVREDVFIQLREWIYSNIGDFPAFGVMFLDIGSDLMSPVVYVRDVDTTYFEGSCASGTVAAAYSLNATSCVPVRTHVFRQPAGTLEVEVHIENGSINKMLLDGFIAISEKGSIEI